MVFRARRSRLGLHEALALIEETGRSYHLRPKVLYMTPAQAFHVLWIGVILGLAGCVSPSREQFAQPPVEKSRRHSLVWTARGLRLRRPAALGRQPDAPLTCRAVCNGTFRTSLGGTSTVPICPDTGRGSNRTPAPSARTAPSAMPSILATRSAPLEVGFSVPML